LWIATPSAVRQVIRRTDDLTGTRRGPNWRRPLIGTLFAAVALAVPVDMPQSDNCDGRFQRACAEPIERPALQMPTFTLPPNSFPNPLPTFSFPVPDFSPPTSSPAP
jgi:hypothetical protein